MRRHRLAGPVLAAALLVLAGLLALGGFIDLFARPDNDETRASSTPGPVLKPVSAFLFGWTAPTPTPVSWDSAAQNWGVIAWQIGNLPVEPPPEAVLPEPPPDPPVEAAPVEPPPVQAVEPVPSGQYYNYTMASEVLGYVNGARASYGLGSLMTNGALMGAAQAYAQLLTELGLFTHDAGGGFTARILASGYTGRSFGEALWEGWGSFRADAVVNDWLNSPSHRDILLGPYSEGGVACYVDASAGQPNTRCVLDVGAP